MKHWWKAGCFCDCGAENEQPEHRPISVRFQMAGPNVCYFYPVPVFESCFLMLHETFEELLNDISTACKACYGDRLLSLAVYGSVARRTQRYDSDIDLLLVVHGLPDGRMPRVSEFERVERQLAAQLAEAATHGIHTRLSPVFRTPAELEAGSPLLLDMVEDARILFDRDATLASRLRRLRRRLQEYGARRIRKGGGYYWQIKPGFRPGDVIEL